MTKMKIVLIYAFFIVLVLFIVGKVDKLTTPIIIGLIFLIILGAAVLSSRYRKGGWGKHWPGSLF